MSMTYVGNYSHAIPESWMSTILSTTGEIRPNEKMSANSEKNGYLEQQRKTWESAGYQILGGSIQWEMFFQKNFTDRLRTEQFDFCNGKEILTWWIPVIRPGKCFPLHHDAFEKSHGNIKRYWIALQDQEWGHIFTYEDKILTNYKRGDVFLFDDVLHASANVGLTTKATLQLVVSE